MDNKSDTLLKTTEDNTSIASDNTFSSRSARHQKALDLSQQVIKKIIEKFPVLAEKEHMLIEQAETFLRDTIAIKYLFNQDGSLASLEGTPKGGLSSEIEFQKTMGSRLILWALNAGHNVFGATPNNIENSPEARLRVLFRSVNEHFSDQFKSSNDSVMTGVLAIHDILKSEEIRQLVSNHLKESPVEIRGITHSVKTFEYLDHDAQLLVALHLMEREISAGTDTRPRSLTSAFFPQEKITGSEHKTVVTLMKTMWGMQLNSLQTNQGENHPAQLKPFLEQVVTMTDTDYVTLKLALKAFCIHEATDLFGAANPSVPVLPGQVVEPVLNMFDKLTLYADNLRQESRTSVVVNIDEKAKEFYRTLLPALSDATLEKVKNTLGNDQQTFTLVSRLGRMCRMQEKDFGQVISALDELSRRDHHAYAALRDMYGNLDKKIYLYYGPALLENFGIKSSHSAQNIPQLTNALHTLGMAVQQSAIEIAKAGGEQNFSQKYGTDFINIRPLCLGVMEYLKTDQAEIFNPTLLKFKLNDNNLDLAYGFILEKIDPKLNKLLELTTGKRVVVFSGFSELGYADIPAFEAQIKDIIDREARYAGGYDKLIIVAGATDDGIGRVYKLANDLGIDTLGIVSQEGSQLVSQYCQQVVLIDDPKQTWKVLAPNKESYMISVAARGGVVYALGGGVVTDSELTEARSRGIETHAYYFEPDPNALAKRKEADQRRGRDVTSYTPVNDSILFLSPKIQPGILKSLADRLFYGRAAFHEFSIKEQQLISRILEPEEIQKLSQRGDDGRALHQAVGILAEKYANPEAFTGDDWRAAFHDILDEEGPAWRMLARELNLSVSTDADVQAGAIVLRGMLQSGISEVPGSIYTQQVQRALGLRARVAQKLQTYIGTTSQGVLALGTIAALCRIKMNNDRMASGKLSKEEIAKLRTENFLALAEMGADLSDVFIDLVQSKFNIQIPRPATGSVKPITSSQSSSLTLGKRMTSGIRGFGPGVTGALVSAVGTGLAWYGVYMAGHELQTLRISERIATDPVLKAQLTTQITQLRVNLSVNIATAIISSGLTVSGAISITASIAASFGLAGAASVAAAAGAFMSVAGPIGGAMLVGAFVGLWIYNGIKTVEEFSRHMELTGWDKFELGFGSLFGWVPDHLHRQYNLQKLRASVEKAAQLEARGIFASLPEIKKVYALIFAEFPYDLNPDRVRNRDINIDVDKNKYVAWSLDGHRELLDPNKFIHVRKTRYQVQQQDAAYQHSTHLSLVGHDDSVIHLPESSWGKQVNSVIQSGKFLSNIENSTVVSLRVEKDTQANNVLKIRAYSAKSTQTEATPSVRKMWTAKIASESQLRTALRVKLDDDNLDDLLMLLSDNVMALKGGKEGFSSVLFASKADTAELRAILNAQSKAKVFSVNEAEYLTLFCIHETTSTISFFKYRKKENGSYQLDVSFSQPLPIQMQLPDDQLGSGVFFQDLDGNGLADLVVVNQDGNLQVALQKRDGHFVSTEEFGVYRAKIADGSRESLSFSEHKILGFGGTKRTLYSVDGRGALYTHTVVSRAEHEAQVSWVNMNISHGVNDYYGYMETHPDNFVASSKSDAGDFIFRLGGGREKTVTGGVNNDSFFLLDGKTHCTVNGNDGNDTLNFSQLNLPADMMGVVVNVSEGKASLRQDENAHTRYSQLERVSFSNIENFTGTTGKDELKGDNNNNIIDGFSGEDAINAGPGQDILKGVSGSFNGGIGIDRYQLRRMPQANHTLVDLIEDYSLGEDSHVSLDYRIDEIERITPENGRHLVITLKTGGGYRLHDFYANTSTRLDQTSAWYITTADGFRFRLQTTATPPMSMNPLNGILVSFQGTSLTAEELGQARVNLYAANQRTGARVELFEKVAGKENVKREIQLPSLFELELRHIGAQGIVTGSHKAELLTGSASFKVKGEGGADTYFIEDSARGVVEIDNDDTSLVPEQDTVILPWKLSETTVSVKDNQVSLKHANQPAHHIEVCLSEFMTGLQSRHLVVRGFLGQAYKLDVTERGVAYLASGSLTLNQEDKLEVLSVSQGGLVLEGRSRNLSKENNKSTVIIDQSGKGNYLAGTERVGNYLQVFDGHNNLFGGRQADELHGGLGSDYMEGKEGNDAYYVKGNAIIQDTGGEDTLVLLAANRVAQEELWLEKTIQGNLCIRFRNDSNRTVTVQGYDKPNQKIEHIVMGNARLSHGDIDNLIDAMAGMPVFADSTATQVLSEAMSRWSSWVASPTV